MGLGEVSVLGLGCARLGSLTEPRSRRESLSLIAAAVNAGITLFDTADIYAQGESERILGEALKSIDACIVTKAGQISSLGKSVPLPLRGAITSFFAHSSLARAAAIRARAKPLPRNYTPEYLRRALLGSLDVEDRHQQQQRPEQYGPIVLASLGIGAEGAGIVVADHDNETRTEDGEQRPQTCPPATPGRDVAMPNGAERTTDIADMSLIEDRASARRLAEIGREHSLAPCA